MTGEGRDESGGGVRGKNEWAERQPSKESASFWSRCLENRVKNLKISTAWQRVARFFVKVSPILIC